MLRLMLDGHPEIVCPGECDFLLDYLVPAQSGAWRYDLEALAEDRIFRASTARLPETDDALPALASMIGDLRGSSEGCLILVLHRGLDRILNFDPDIPILHLLRDPRDVARSAIGMGWAGNVYFGADTWLKTEREWEKVAMNLRAGQFLDFHYENLVRRPEEVLRQICEFLNKDYDSEMLNFPNNSTYSAVDSSLAFQWRRKLTPRDLGLIEPLFGDLMTKRGYELSGHPSISPNLAMRLRLRVEHSTSVWRRRVYRHGLRDPLIVSFCKKLGLNRFARSAQRRMDVTTQKHLK